MDCMPKVCLICASTNGGETRREQKGTALLDLNVMCNKSILELKDIQEALPPLRI
jgi:hypothetical protein